MQVELTVEQQQARQQEHYRACRAALQKEVERFVGKGYRVVSQSEYAAQMVKPKGFSFKWLLLWMLVTFFTVGVLGATIYLIWYWTRKDSQVYLTVDDQAKVHKR